MHSGPVRVHLVPHTHWDREWYHPSGRFRQRLAALIDELLDSPESAPPSFLLDGQAVVLDDYLAVRPERAGELAAAVRSGRLEAGPWYVLPDELIPGGEALVRNLLAGRRALRALRAMPPAVLYCPDSFGHPAMLPAIAAGFGLPIAIVWRGYGGARWPAGDVVRWIAPDSASVLVYHLPPGGYETGSNLPTDPAEASGRWSAIERAIIGRATLGFALLPNGADHHALQSNFAEALIAISAAAAPHEVVAGSLRDFGEALLHRARGMSIAEVHGELRDSYGYCWTLQGTFGARARQKRENALVERMLVRDCEPWAALARHGGGISRRQLTAAAWRELLLCHPHDTLCGTSTDEVARAMDARLEDASSQARGVREDALLDLVRHDASGARPHVQSWRNLLLLRNPAPRLRGGAVTLDLTLPRAHVRVGPGSEPDPAAPAPVPEDAGLPVLDGGAIPLQVIGRRRRHRRVESPRHYPYDELVDVVRVVAWLPPIGGYSIHALKVGETGVGEEMPQPASTAVRNPVREERGCLTNGLLRVEPGAAGSPTLAPADGGRRIESLLALEIVRDAGDSYTHGPVGDAEVHEAAAARITESGPLRGTIQVVWRVAPPAWPARARPAASGSQDRGMIELRASLTLLADSPLLRIELAGVNRATDHRLRLLLRTGVVSAGVMADGAFGPVRRSRPKVPPDEASVESPPPTAPMHRYVSLDGGEAGATVFGDGLAEYEAMADGTVALTLIRAVGELSRNDIPERPGHAGWPVRTPGAQMRGPFRARFGVMLHGERSAAAIDEIERAADDLLVPISGSSLRSALVVPPPSGGLTLEGRGLAFSCVKESEDGGWLVLRCVNLNESAVSGAWTLSRPPREAVSSRFDETPGAPIEVVDGRVTFEAAPREAVTILVR